MRDLMGRLTGLDPTVSATLQVVSYFDTLVAGESGVAVLLRGAAALAGCPVSYQECGRTVLRVSATGERMPTDDIVAGADVDFSGWRVVLERTGQPHVNDDMILERLAFAVTIARSRINNRALGGAAMHTLLAEESTAGERQAAAGRLGLSLTGHYRVHARPVDARNPGLHSRGLAAALVTPYGLAHAVIVAAESVDPEGRVGVGISSAPAGLRDSFATAVTALKLTDTEHPLVKADDLGVIAALAHVPASDSHNPDVIAVTDCAPEEVHFLDLVTSTATIREAARLLGLHHSTVHTRAVRLSQVMGYDLLSSTGRTRFRVARVIQRLADPAPLGS